MSARDWDDRFGKGEHVQDAPHEFLARLIPEGNGRQALDLACGAGRHAALFASKGWQVTAVDFSERALALVRDRDRRIATVRADLATGEFPIEADCWDLICISLYMQRDLFTPIGAGVRCGGLLALAFPMVDEREGVPPMRRDFLIGPGELSMGFGDFEILHDVETEPAPPKRRMAEFLGRRRPRR